MLVSAIIPAAGFGLRIKRDIPKALIPLEKKPIFIHTLEIIAKHPKIKEIILAVPRGYLDLFKKIIKDYRIKKVKEVLEGGLQRQESVRKSLEFVDKKIDFVLIHDAVRPFINLKLLSKVIGEAEKYKAVTLGVPLVPTIKLVDKEGFVKETLNRKVLFETQTPQVFKKDLIIKAHQKFKGNDFSDDAQMVEKLGFKVKMLEGDFLNIKITYPLDLVLAKFILKNKKGYGF